MVLTRRHDGSAVVDPSKTSKTNGRYSQAKKEKTPLWVILALVCIVVISVVTIPRPFHPEGEPSISHVFYYGWLTAISTGLGVVPFIFMPDVPTFWVGVSNGKDSL
jgi:hypothetical protein